MSKNIDLNKNKKIAIVLLNLGGPDSLKNVKPFLYNLFSDKNIILLPPVIRHFIAWMISTFRKKTSQDIYALIGGKSPILEETSKQKQALEKELKNKIENYEIFISMRHWHPFSEEVIEKIEKYSPDEILLIPLYPHFSTTTTGSSVEDFLQNLKKRKNKAICKTLCCYPVDELFIQSHASLIKKQIEQLGNIDNTLILFSAHGLPEKIVEAGDPYQWQIEQTVSKILDNLKDYDINHKITYQSRVGPVKWISPSTEDEITEAGKSKTNLIIVPISFVSDHVETLVELDIEYKEIADTYDIMFHRTPVLAIDDFFVKSIAQNILKLVKNNDVFVTPSNMARICPEKYIKCPCKIKLHQI